MKRAIRAVFLAGVGGLTSAAAHAFTLENGTIWPLSVSIGGAPPQTVPAEDVAFLFRGQCPSGCTLSIAVADPLRAQTVIGALGDEAPTIQGNGDAVNVRVRMIRGGSAMTVEVVGDLASEASTTAISAPFSGSPTGPTGTPPALTAPPSVPGAAPSSQQAPQSPQSQQTPPGFLPPPPPPDY